MSTSNAKSKLGNQLGNQFVKRLEQKIGKIISRAIKILSSLKLAVVVIVALGAITAVGTFIEAQYDAVAAKKIVYDSVWMYSVMGVLIVNLIAVIVDRYPWKKHHLSFVLAHIGIIVLLFGALITLKFGIDGQIRIGIGESNKMVMTNETDLVVYASFDGDRYTKLLDKPVDFFLEPPTREHPLEIPTDGGVIQLVEYKKYVFPKQEIVASTAAKAGSALRFQISNANVNVVEWLLQRRPTDLAKHEFGPATIFLGQAPEIGHLENEIYLTSIGDQLKYTVYRKDSPHPFKTGKVKPGGSFDTGWMGLQVKVIDYLPKAEEKWEVKDSARPTPLTTSAVKVKFNDREQWVLLNDIVKLFTDKAVYLVSYGNRRIDLGFAMTLKKFEVGHYQGTAKAMSYQSLVEVPELGERLISMNEPLKYKGLTFYQASFEDGPNGPKASVLSVNHDPGRWLKYLGCLIMVTGIVMLFYFKKWYMKKK